MTKQNCSSSEEKVISTSGNPFVKPIDKCNELLIHEHKEWDVPSLENLKHNNDAAVNAAYRYLTGYRRLVDPLNQPTPKKWYAFVLLGFIAGAIACYYAFNI
jgi:hypothetical protein